MSTVLNDEMLTSHSFVLFGLNPLLQLQMFRDDVIMMSKNRITKQNFSALICTVSKEDETNIQTELNHANIRNKLS